MFQYVKWSRAGFKWYDQEAGRIQVFQKLNDKLKQFNRSSTVVGDDGIHTTNPSGLHIIVDRNTREPH